MSLQQFLLSFCFFFFNDTATTEIYTLSLHDALPIWVGSFRAHQSGSPAQGHHHDHRSEEHTSELQSLRHLVCRLLLEKKKTRRFPLRHALHATPEAQLQPRRAVRMLVGAQRQRGRGGQSRHRAGREVLFFFNDTATTEIYTLSLHDALPICDLSRWTVAGEYPGRSPARRSQLCRRSEEHTSELQSLRHLVCRLLLEKKKHTRSRRFPWLKKRKRIKIEI